MKTSDWRPTNERERQSCSFRTFSRERGLKRPRCVVIAVATSLSECKVEYFHNFASSVVDEQISYHHQLITTLWPSALRFCFRMLPWQVFLRCSPSPLVCPYPGEMLRLPVPTGPYRDRSLSHRNTVINDQAVSSSARSYTAVAVLLVSFRLFPGFLMSI